MRLVKNARQQGEDRTLGIANTCSANSIDMSRSPLQPNTPRACLSEPNTIILMVNHIVSMGMNRHDSSSSAVCEAFASHSVVESVVH